MPSVLFQGNYREVLMKAAAVVLMGIGLMSAVVQAAHGDAARCLTMQMTTLEATAGIGTRDITSPDGAVVHVSKEVLLTRNDFTDANVTLTEGQIVLNVGLTPEASKRWVDFTTNNVGRTVAFVVGDRLVRSVKILDPNRGAGFLLGPLPKPEAQLLADSINQRCVPDAR
jgi:preprotein translocase subunit SecD